MSEKDDAYVARNLSYRDIDVLDLLEPHCGLVTSQVAARTYEEISGGARRNSAAVRQRLLRLERMGLVGPLDGRKPVCWRLTEYGASIKAMKLPNRIARAPDA